MGKILDSLSFGTDAELFLTTVSGEFIPVTGFVGGTKEKPIPIQSLGKGYFKQEDNAALEFNTPPTKDITTFCKQIVHTVNVLQKQFPPSIRLAFRVASAEFDASYIKNIIGLDRFGCEPDYNAWTMEMNPRPKPETIGFRSAAGHIHLGWDHPTMEEQLEMIRLADVFVSLGVLAPHESTTDWARRSLYGKAGAFRPKDYGVEHRVPSNLWVGQSGLTEWMLLGYQQAARALDKGIVVEKKDYEPIQYAINKPDGALRNLLVSKYERFMVPMEQPHELHVKSLDW